MLIVILKHSHSIHDLIWLEISWKLIATVVICVTEIQSSDTTYSIYSHMLKRVKLQGVGLPFKLVLSIYEDWQFDMNVLTGFII